MIALFVSGIGGQTLPVRIWNSPTLAVEPAIAAVSTVLIAVRLAILLVDFVIRAALARRSS